MVKLKKKREKIRKDPVSQVKRKLQRSLYIVYTIVGIGAIIPILTNLLLSTEFTLTKPITLIEALFFYIATALALILAVKAYSAYLYIRTIEATQKILQQNLSSLRAMLITAQPVQPTARPIPTQKIQPQLPKSPPLPSQQAQRISSAPRVEPKLPPTQPAITPTPVLQEKVVPQPITPQLQEGKKKCPYCGRVLPFGDIHTICPFCGRKLK